MSNPEVAVEVEVEVDPNTLWVHPLSEENTSKSVSIEQKAAGERIRVPNQNISEPSVVVIQLHFGRNMKIDSLFFGIN